MKDEGYGERGKIRKKGSSEGAMQKQLGNEPAAQYVTQTRCHLNVGFLRRNSAFKFFMRKLRMSAETNVISVGSILKQW